MLEARLEQAEILKKILDAIKELVTDANFDCSDEGIKLQAMDNSHVALVSLYLSAASFQDYRCDRNMSLGMSLTSLQKIIKSAQNDDQLTMRADESQDVLGLLFENKSDRIAEYEMKLMDIDQEHLGIPDTVYDAEIMLPATEFARVIRDLKELGESVKIEVTKEGVRFSSDGDIGSASVTIKPTKENKKGSDDEDSDEEEEEEEEESEEEKDDSDDDIVVEGDKPKTEENDDEDNDVVIPGKKSKKAIESDDDEDEKPEVTQMEIADDDEDDDKKKAVKKEKKPEVKKEVKKEKKDAKKRKPTTKEVNKKNAKKAKTAPKKEKKEENPKEVTINVQQSVTLTFSIKYLSNFAKSTPLSNYVHLHMSNEVPLLVEYPFGGGHIRYYLAPKISED